MKIKLLVLCITTLCLTALPTMAATWAPPGSSLQTVFDNITLGPVPGSSSINVTTDYLLDSTDSYWTNTGGGSVHSIIIEQAAYAGTNTFGIYDSTDHTNFLQVFAGANDAGDSKTVILGSSGQVWLDTQFESDGHTERTPDKVFGSLWFGYYLDSTGDSSANPPNEGVWYSDTSLNSDNSGSGYDHMFAYQGEGDNTNLPDPIPDGVIGPSYYYLCWEDLNGDVGSDWDYTDMVVLVESVMVPVPAAVILGILGMGIAGLKLRKYA